MVHFIHAQTAHCNLRIPFLSANFIPLFSSHSLHAYCKLFEVVSLMLCLELSRLLVLHFGYISQLPLVISQHISSISERGSAVWWQYMQKEGLKCLQTCSLLASHEITSNLFLLGNQLVNFDNNIYLVKIIGIVLTLQAILWECLLLKSF